MGSSSNYLQYLRKINNISKRNSPLNMWFIYENTTYFVAISLFWIRCPVRCNEKWLIESVNNSFTDIYSMKSPNIGGYLVCMAKSFIETPYFDHEMLLFFLSQKEMRHFVNSYKRRFITVFKSDNSCRNAFTCKKHDYFRGPKRIFCVVKLKNSSAIKIQILHTYSPKQNHPF